MATWQLDPKVAHLNHGSFGACPNEVLDAQQRFRDEMERSPVAFLLYTYQPALEASRAALANFVGADAAGIVFVPNATYGVNSVLRSVETVFPRGAEILLTDHAYNACRNAAEVSAQRFEGSIVVAEIPFPIIDPQQAVDAVLGRVTNRTALVMLDHVTSPTGIILPVEQLVLELEPDIPVLIDGAHAPGMIDIDLGALGASFYTGNCHKWLCAPKGAGFLHVDERHRSTVHGSVVSHGHNGGWPNSDSRFHSLFDWTGTDDPSARLSVPTAIEVMEQHHPDGWPGIRAGNHELVLHGRQIVGDALGVEPPAPGSMIGSIASLQVHAKAKPPSGIFDQLMFDLHDTWSIEVPVFGWPDPDHRLLRISAQQYNTTADYERLAEALGNELA
jgi:isopenicillin-N epimerase